MEMSKDNNAYESLLQVFNGVSMSWMRKYKCKFEFEWRGMKMEVKMSFNLTHTLVKITLSHYPLIKMHKNTK